MLVSCLTGLQTEPQVRQVPLWVHEQQMQAAVQAAMQPPPPRGSPFSSCSAQSLAAGPTSPWQEPHVTAAFGGGPLPPPVPDKIHA